MAVHCPECGFINGEGAHYCQRCGAFIASDSGSIDTSTMTYRVAETGEIEPVALSEEVERGATLVVRHGGGREGEVFVLHGSRVTIGRHPGSDIFLDDVTVSRDHALIVHRDNGYYLDDRGSLNGSYVNRRRIDSVRLSDGDEVQIGKYKFAFLTSSSHA